MNHESCVNVTLTDSAAVEMPESFHVALKKPADLNERISINTARDEMEVEIIDDDGEYDEIGVGLCNSLEPQSEGASLGVVAQ